MAEPPLQPAVKPAVPELGRFWTVANMLSLLRGFLAIPLAYLIYIDGPIRWIIGLSFAAVASDWFDGRVARWSHTVSDWGKVLDPVADKVGAVLVVGALTLRGSLPVWLLVLIFVRDFLIVIGGISLARHTNVVWMSKGTGKFAIGALALTVLAALLKADPPIMQFCIWATVVLMVYSFFGYLFRYIRQMRRAQVARRELLAEQAAQASATDTTSI